jgi:hypothetical protein
LPTKPFYWESRLLWKKFLNFLNCVPDLIRMKQDICHYNFVSFEIWHYKSWNWASTITSLLFFEICHYVIFSWCTAIKSMHNVLVLGPYFFATFLMVHQTWSLAWSSWWTRRGKEWTDEEGQSLPNFYIMTYFKQNANCNGTDPISWIIMVYFKSWKQSLA